MQGHRQRGPVHKMRRNREMFELRRHRPQTGEAARSRAILSRSALELAFEGVLLTALGAGPKHPPQFGGYATPEGAPENSNRQHPAK
jgi:hypothetical protein